MTKFLGLSYEIQYSKGAENVDADALSRFEEGDCCGLTTVQPKWVEDIIDSYTNDDEVQKFITQLSVDVGAVPRLELQEGILRHYGKV